MPTDILFFIYKILDVVLCYYKPFLYLTDFFFTTYLRTSFQNESKYDVYFGF